MNINIFSVLYVVGSIFIANLTIEKVMPGLTQTFGLTDQQELWVLMLIVWSIGYWGHALKVGMINLTKTEVEETNDKKQKTS